MEKIFVGVDGGGTKTAYAICDSNGKILARVEKGTSSYRQIGIEEVCTQVKETIFSLIDELSFKKEQVGNAFLALPCFGENREMDTVIEEKIKQYLHPIPVIMGNDVEAGYHGAIGRENGIVIVAGTGSIAFGMDGFGNTARSGGWSEHFGDEGSCYWVGKKAMELFCRESDGRKEKAALYKLVKDEFKLDDDFDFVTIMEAKVVPNRTKTAGFQRLLLKAAELGDESAAKIYECAAQELFYLALAVKNKLNYQSAHVPVAVIGGIRHAGNFVFPKLSELLEKNGMKLIGPKEAPVDGAAHYAMSFKEKKAINK